MATEGTENHRKKVRRGQARKNVFKTFKVMYNNVRGIKSKEEVLRRIVSEENPVIMAIGETKLKKGDWPEEIEGYVIKRNDRDTD